MSKTILVVDDFESSRNIICRTLAQAGYSILEENTGEKALAHLNGQSIDLIITDWNMPEMDGISLIKNIRLHEGYAYTPVILLTSESKSQDKQQRAKEAGATAWLDKPFKVDTILETVKRLIR